MLAVAFLLLSAVALAVFPKKPTWATFTFQDEHGLPCLNQCKDRESFVHTLLFCVHDEFEESIRFFRAADMFLSLLQDTDVDQILNKVITEENSLSLVQNLAAITNEYLEFPDHEHVVLSLVRKLRYSPAFAVLINGFAARVNQYQKNRIFENQLSDFAVAILELVPVQERCLPSLSPEIRRAIEMSGVCSEKGVPGPYEKLLPEPLNHADRQTFSSAKLWDVIYGNFHELLKENPNLTRTLLLMRELPTELSCIPHWETLTASQLHSILPGLHFKPDQFKEAVAWLEMHNKSKLIEVLIDSHFTKHELTSMFFNGQPDRDSVIVSFLGTLNKAHHSLLVRKLLRDYQHVRHFVAQHQPHCDGPDLRQFLKMAKQRNYDAMVKVFVEYEDVLAPKYNASRYDPSKYYASKYFSSGKAVSCASSRDHK